MEEKNLVVPITITPEKLFAPKGLDPILKAVEQKVKEFKGSVETDKDRKEIASFAYKIAQTKTTIEKWGKDLVSGEKAKLKLIDTERKRSKDFLTEQAAIARKPLTDYEDAEKARKEEERQLEIFNMDHAEALEMESLFERERVIAAKEAEIAKAEEEKREKEQAELEAKEKVEREEQIKKEAGEKATRDAAEAIQDAKIKRITDLGLVYDGQQWKNDIAHVAVLDLQTLKDDDFDRLICDIKKVLDKRDEDRIEAERCIANEKAKAAQEAAVQKTKDDAEANAKEEQEEKDRKIAEEKAIADKKAANRNHQKRINREILADLSVFIPDEDLAKEFIKAVIKMDIRHLSINY